MGTEVKRVLSFVEGANTTALGVTSEPVWNVFEGARIDHGASQRMHGKSPLAQLSAVSTIVDFDGTNDKVILTTDSRVFPLGTRWTLETLFISDDVSSDHFILGRNSATAVALSIKQTTSSTVVVTVTDSGSNTSTLTWTGIGASTLCALTLARDGATLLGYLNGVSKSATMNATNALLTGGAMALGTDNGGSWHNGAVDKFTIYKTYDTSQRGAWMRTPHPRAENVLLDIIVTLDANGYALDRGPYEAHATSSGSPATNRTALAFNIDPIDAIGVNLDTSGRRQGYVVAGDRCYPVTFG